MAHHHPEIVTYDRSSSRHEHAGPSNGEGKQVKEYRQAPVGLGQKRRIWRAIANPRNLQCRVPPSRPDGLSGEEIQEILSGGFWMPSQSCDPNTRDSACDMVPSPSKFAQYQASHGHADEDYEDDYFAFEAVPCLVQCFSCLWTKIRSVGKRRKRNPWKDGMMVESVPSSGMRAPLLFRHSRRDSAGELFESN